MGVKCRKKCPSSDSNILPLGLKKMNWELFVSFVFTGNQTDPPITRTKQW
jgi:hypothetical protein